MPRPKERKKQSSRKIPQPPRPTPTVKALRPPETNSLVLAGAALVTLSAIVILSIFFPVIRAELSFLFSGEKNVKVVGKSEAMVSAGGPARFEIVRPVDENFGIVIPKININVKVIPDVDPENGPQYQKALTQGVAHSRGTKYPGEEGNVFIFAHSGQDLLEANRYNAVFYLLSKLEAGDEIFIFFQNKKYRYLVSEKNTAAPEEVRYMNDTPGKKTLTLMTCWPGGTTWKRLIVVAEQS